MKEEFETPEPQAPILVAIWLGAVVQWVLKGFAGSFKAQLNNKNQSRNMWTGYITQLVVISVLVYFAYKNTAPA